MGQFLKIASLALFASAGVGLAIAVAMYADELPMLVDGQAFGGAVADREDDGAKDALPALDLPASPPSPAPSGGLVASQVKELEAAAERIEKAQRQSQLDRLANSIDEVKQSSQQQERLIGRSIRSLDAAVEKIAQAETRPPAGETGDGAETIPPAAPKVERGSAPGRITVNVRDTDLRQVLDYLGEQGETNIVASPSVGGTVTASLTDVTVDEAVAALVQLSGLAARREKNFIYVGQPEELRTMDQVRDTIATRVYRPNYITSAELQSLITPLLTPTTGQVSVTSPSQVGIPSDGAQAGGDNFADNDVLLVRDYEMVLREIDKVVAAVDRRPRQVAIEVMILSVNLDDSHRMGVNMETLRDNLNTRVVSGSPLVNLGSIDINSGGLNVGFLDSSLAIFVEALERVGDTSVIARPRLMCLNKQRAEILIGDQLGYLSTTQTVTASTQSVEFLDVGTQLRIRPFIGSDGMIRMEVHPELSTGEVRLLGGFALPEKSVTQVTTNVMCHDGATVVIGGLIREDLNKTTGQIPLLGDIPLLGRIFRRNDAGVRRSEILVLITPRIIHDPAELYEGTPTSHDLHERQADIYSRKMTPVARRYYGKRYVRLARSAWAAGDADEALSYLELSLRFSPHRFDALNLRDEILAGAGHVVETHDAPLSAWETPLESPPVPVARPVAPASFLDTTSKPGEPLDNGQPPRRNR